MNKYTEDDFNEIYKMNGAYEKKIDTIKAEAIKEYKEKVIEVLLGKSIFPVLVKNALNEAEKEMVGENDVWRTN